MLKPIKRFAINHLEPRLYGALWCSAGVIAVGIASGLAYDAHVLSEKLKFATGILTVNVAMIGWIWSGRMSILMARKTNAVNALYQLRSKEIAEAKSKVYPYIEAYDKFKRDDCGQARPAMPESEIQQLLGVYEQLSVGVIYGALDYDIIKESQRLVFKRIYRGLCHHIERAQETDGDYFIHFENLTCTWHPELQKRPAALTHPGGLFAPMRNADA